jgi:Bacterial type II and III secretion system protein
MWKRLLAAGVAAAVLLAVAAVSPAAPKPPSPPEPTKKKTHKVKLVTKTYNVGDLVVPIADGNPVTALDEVVCGKEDGKRKEGGTCEDHLIRLLTHTVSPKSWSTAGGHGSVEYFPLSLALVVNQTPSVHEKIEKLLSDLRRLQETQVAIEVCLVSVTDTELERLRKEFGFEVEAGKKVSELNEEQRRRLLTLVQENPDSHVVAMPKLTTFNGQSATVSLGENPARLFTEEEIRKSGDEAPSGITMSVRPVVSADRGTIYLKFSLPEMDVEKTLRLADGGTAVLTGCKVLGEVRRESSPPVVSRIPYVNRLFKTVGVSREEMNSLILVTPRVLVLKEEEERRAAGEKGVKDAPRNESRIPVLPPAGEGEPTLAEVLRAMPSLPHAGPSGYEEFRDNVEVVKERLTDKVDPPRFYPLVGPAQLHHSHWKCTVYFTETVDSGYPFPCRLTRPRVEVVYLDKDHLAPCAATTPAEDLIRR